MATIITITLNMEKATKNCVKFAEVPENEFMPEKIGTVYVQKAALAEIGYAGGNVTMKLCADASVAEDGDIQFVPEKATKNCVKFNEVTENEWVPEKIGSLYIPKITLVELGWVPETNVVISMELPE